MKNENIVATKHSRRSKLLLKYFTSLGILLVTMLYADSGFYVCSNEQAYKDYKNGLVSNLDGATHYGTELLCSYGCNQYEVCKPEKIYNSMTSPIFNCIDATKARELQNFLSTQQFQTVYLKSLGVPLWSLDFGAPKNGNAFIFPHAFDLPTNMSAWDNNGTSVKISKDASNYIEIIMTIEGNAEHNVSGKIYKGDKSYSIKGVINGTQKLLQCGIFDNLGMSSNYENQIELVTNADTFYCPLRKSENIGGDYNKGSNFQSQTTCNSACTVKNECVQVADTPCKAIDIKYSQPVTDYTGKSVYTKREISYECNNTVTKTVGCANWKVITNQGSVDVNMSNVGTVFKDRKNSIKETNVLSSMLEEQLHVFTGWKGQCDKGKVFNNPFSDPFKLLSYAMMVYTSSARVTTNEMYGYASTQAPMGETMANLHDKFDNAMTSFKNGWSEITKVFTPSNIFNTTDVQIDDYSASFLGSSTSFVEDAASSGVISSVETITSNIKEYLSSPIHTLDVGYGAVKVYLVDYIQLGMSMMPTKQEMQTAYDFNQAWLGDENSDNQSVAYATCMAAIGLSYPNLVSYLASDMNATSSELNYPYNNPIRLSYSQIQYLAGATSQSFVENMYAYVSNNPASKYVTVIAKNGQAYYQAGQVICGGKLAVAANANNVSTPTNDSSSNIGEAVAMMAVKKLIGAMPPPCNIMATVLVDLVMAFDSVNACSNLDDATKLGVLQMKTNRFINYDQCYSAGSKCQKKFLGSCILRRNYHCCYDQISTRIFAEGVKEQLGLDRNVCDNINIEYLKQISFRKCNDGENPVVNKCFPANKWEEYQAAITAKGVTGFDAGSLVQTGINSLGVTTTLQCK